MSKNISAYIKAILFSAILRTIQPIHPIKQNHNWHVYTIIKKEIFILNFFIDQAGILHMYRLPLCNGKSIAVK